MERESHAEAAALKQPSHDRVRQVTLWLPDTSDPAFKAEYRRQVAAVAEHDRRAKFADRIEPDESDLLGWV